MWIEGEMWGLAGGVKLHFSVCVLWLSNPYQELTTAICFNKLPVFSFLYNVGCIYVVASNMLALHCAHKQKCTTLQPTVFVANEKGIREDMTQTVRCMWINVNR